MQEQSRLGEMIYNLLQVEEEAWGFYAFSRELLKDRISTEDKTEMITKAIRCGKEYAKQMIKECGSSEIQTIAEKLKLKVSFQDTSMTGKRVLFALFTPPDNIQIMEEPIRQAAKLIAKEDAVLVELFQQDGIIDTILGHEIFHFIEERFEKEIYTKTKKILLWNFIGLKNYSTIRTLGEIAAMAFTKELNGLTYSPFLLDILLYFSYDCSGAEKIYSDILEMSSGRCRETVEDCE